jgi:thioredoxin 1
MLQLILWAGVGAGLGAMIGYFGRCSSGTCPLTSTWWRGALYGALLAIVFYYGSGQSSSAAMNQSTQNVKLITENQFESEVAQSLSPVVVDFYASWCGPCKALSPLLDDLAGPFTNRLKFVKINADTAPALCQRFDIQGLPTLLFFKDGKVVDKQVELPEMGFLKERLEFLASEH